MLRAFSRLLRLKIPLTPRVIAFATIRAISLKGTSSPELYQAFVGFEHAAQNEACVVLGVFQGPKAVRRALTFNGFDPIGRHGRNKGA